MKDIGWKLIYFPAWVLSLMGLVIAIIVGMPIIVWILINDTTLHSIGEIHS